MNSTELLPQLLELNSTNKIYLQNFMLQETRNQGSVIWPKTTMQTDFVILCKMTAVDRDV